MAAATQDYRRWRRTPDGDEQHRALKRTDVLRDPSVLLELARNPRLAWALAIRTAEGHDPGPPGHWIRQAMRADVEERLRSEDTTSKDVLEISGADLTPLARWKSATEWWYPDFDITAPLERDERFDVVLCDQVLEHLADPAAGVRTIFELLRPGGLAIIGVPFLIRVHGTPSGSGDFWRFSPAGLTRLLSTAADFREVDVRSWGNRACVRANLDVWATKTSFRSLRNEPDVPVVVWAYARK